MSTHASDRDFIKKHHGVRNDTEGGKCLTRHISRVSRSSCSHRWQAWRRAVTADSDWYNTYATDAAKVFKPPPTAPSWDLTQGKNFQKSARKPYRHNAHHIIPNSILRDCINDAAARDPAKGARLRILIRGGLLDAGYNLNHMINMIILPLGRRTSWVIKLPAHLEKGARSHEEYSAAVTAKVMEEVQRFQSVLSQDGEKHPATPAKLAKKGLETASTRFRKAIRSWGEARHQLYIDRIPMAHFAKFF